MDARRAILVADFGFGDAGKGTIIDFLARYHDARTVVRFNGGPQAGHNVVTPDGRHHTFSQFGSATFLPSVCTLVSRFMLIEPYALLNEAAHLDELKVHDALDRLKVDRRCAVISPCQQVANRLRELARGDLAHGTCGMGVGETAADLIDHPDLVLHAGDLPDRRTIRRKLLALRDLKITQLCDVLVELRADPRAQRNAETLLDPSWVETAVDTYAWLAARISLLDETAAEQVLRSPGILLFEGAQGALLDESFGFHPHTTWSNTTFGNAETLLNEAGYDSLRTRVGVLRTYSTRHGPGPLVTEDAGLRSLLSEPHNEEKDWQGRFRVGPLDVVASRYATEVVGGVDTLAITHLDRLPCLPTRICTAYRYPKEEEPGDCFVWDGDEITGIRVHRSVKLAHQARLTRALTLCRPIFTIYDHSGSEGFVNTIRRELRRPVAILSFGPAADQKRVIPDAYPPCRSCRTL